MHYNLHLKENAMQHSIFYALISHLVYTQYTVYSKFSLFPQRIQHCILYMGLWTRCVRVLQPYKNLVKLSL
jgi:hypothetical protein